MTPAPPARPSWAGFGPRSLPILWALPASLAAFLVARCVMLSAKRMLLGDEFFTWYPVTAPFRSMLASTRDTINAAPPLYFVGAWCWAAVFGGSAQSLRLISALAAAAAVLAMFAALRRAYGALAAAAALTVAFMDPELLSQSVSARFYTLLLAETALAVLLYQRMMMRRRPSAGLLAANAALHACMVMTQYFGLVYSGIVLAAVLVTSLLRRRNPVRAGLSIVAGWLVFLPWIPVFRRHMQMGRPTFWIPVPKPGDLAQFYGHYLTGDFWLLALVLCALASAALVLALADRADRRGTRSGIFALRRPEAPLLIMALLLGLVPLAIYFMSTRAGATSSFLERYFLPSALGWAIVLSHVANRVFRLGSLTARRGAARALAGAQAAGVILFIGWCGWNLLGAAHAENAQDMPARLPAAVTPREPVVVEDYHEFLTLHFYSPEPQRYLFLVDPEVGLRVGGGGPAVHQIMATLKRRFPDRFKEVLASGDFLAGATDFWVRVHKLEWWQLRVEHNPDFATVSFISDRRLLHVRRRP